MAQKQEEDRLREQAKQEKKAEKDKRKAESVKQHQAAVSQAASNKSTVSQVKSAGAKNEKKSERQQTKKMKPKVAGNKTKSQVLCIFILLVCFVFSRNQVLRFVLNSSCYFYGYSFWSVWRWPSFLPSTGRVP